LPPRGRRPLDTTLAMLPPLAEIGRFLVIVVLPIVAVMTLFLLFVLRSQNAWLRDGKRHARRKGDGRGRSRLR